MTTGSTHKNASRAAALVLAAIVFVSASVSGVRAGDAAGAVLGNTDILALTRANVAPALIINQIQASPNNFDLSDQAFMELKAGGVADEVLNAMLAAGRAGAAAGAAGAALAGVAQQGTAMAQQLSALPQMPSVSLPPLGQMGSGSDWSDFGQDLAALPPPPALPAFSAPPPAAPSVPSVSSPAVPSLPALSQLPSLPQMPSLSAQTPAAAAPVVAAVPAVSAPAADPFTYVPPVSAAPAPAVPAPPVAPAFSAPVAAQQMPQQGGANALRQTLASSTGQPEAQAGAVRALGEMNDRASLPAIRDLLGSPSPVVRKEAAKALALMNDTTAIGAAEQNLGNPVDPLDGLIHLVGYARLVRASDRLGAILSTNPSAVNRAAAAGALAEIGRGGAAAWPALENALANDSDASVRREAARAVAQFHDPSSAALLMNACRRDPGVRKVALEAMAQYPETMDFLVGVVGLGADQIAPDESEAARASLAKLTGQDFGFDGAQWSAWLAANKPGFASAPGGSMLAAAPAAPVGIPGGMFGGASAAAPAAGATGLSGALPPPTSVGGVISAGTPGQVDLTALGMIVDPSQIPMAPELDNALGGGVAAPADGVLRVPGSGLGLGIPPAALSANDFGNAGTGTGTGTGGAGIGAGAAAGADGFGGLLGVAGAGASGSGGVGTGRLPTPAGFEEYSDDQMWGGSMPAGGAGDMTGMSTPPPSMSALPPRQPVVEPPSVPADTGASPGGLRLALPPMAGGGGDAGFGAPTDFAAPPADSFAPPTEYADTAGYAEYDDSQWPQYTDEGGAADPYTDPYADPYAQGGATGEPYDSPDTLAFPGDTDAFGIGEPMFEDESAGADAGSYDAGSYDAGAYDDGSFDSFDPGTFDSGGAGLAMPPPPGGFVDSGSGSDDYGTDEYSTDDYGTDDFGSFDDSMLVDGTDTGTGTDSGFAETFPAETESTPAPAPAAPAVSFENYDYGDFDDGMSDGDSDFAGDDFAAFLQGVDFGDGSAPAPEAPATMPGGGTGSGGGGTEGTAEWAFDEPAPSAPSASGQNTQSARSSRSGSTNTVMEWVRGRGLVEREVAAPAAAPEVAPEEPPALEPLPEPVPVSELETSVGSTAPAPAAPAAAVTERAEVGAWHYVEPYEAPEAADGAGSDSAGDSGSGPNIEDIPIIAEDVYELPEPVEVITSDPSGRPSRRLRSQR